MEAVTVSTPPPTTIQKTPPSNKPKSASRLSQLSSNNLLDDFESESENNEIPHYQVTYAAPSPSSRKPSSKFSITKTRGGSGCRPMRELLLNISPSPVRKSKTLSWDGVDDDRSGENRRKCRSRVSGNGCGSPRIVRRARRRVENEEKENVGLDEVVKPRKRRISRKTKSEKSDDLVNSDGLSKDNGGESALECLKLMLLDLVMWRDVAKSSLWFGFGCLSCLSYCFTKGFNFSLFSVISQLGLVFLAVSFISNTLLHRENVAQGGESGLKEDDILKVIRVILPALNLAVFKTRQLFSGEPSITLKVASFFFFGAEYGPLLTFWRLCVLGFFTSFTAPKLYSSYATKIDDKVEQYKLLVMETWRGCYHKKIVVASATTIFWNFSSLKTRMFAAFISLVVLRYYQQNSTIKMEQDTVPREGEDNQKQKQDLAKLKEQVKPTKIPLVIVDKKV